MCRVRALDLELVESTSVGHTTTTCESVLLIPGPLCLLYPHLSVDHVEAHLADSDAAILGKRS